MKSTGKIVSDLHKYVNHWLDKGSINQLPVLKEQQQ